MADKIGIDPKLVATILSSADISIDAVTIPVTIRGINIKKILGELQGTSENDLTSLLSLIPGAGPYLSAVGPLLKLIKGLG